MAVETLASTPALGPLYARAALSSRGRGGALPERSLRRERVCVDREHLTAYQRICGFPVGDVLPHTYPHVLGFALQLALMAHRSFPLPLPGLVHVENDITLHRGLSAWDPLDITVGATGLRPHPKGTLVDLVTTVDTAGERAWASRSTYLRREGPHQPAGQPAAASPGWPAPPLSPGVPPPLPSGPPAAVLRLPAGLGRAYARVSGDVNPIHLHPLTARALGFPRTIAHGMWTYARSLAQLGPRTAQPSASHVWFARPVLLPSRVELVVGEQGDVTVAGLRPPAEPGRAQLVLSLTAATPS